MRPNSGDVDISDQIKLFGFLFGGNNDPLPCGDGTLSHLANVTTFDFNGDGDIDISDGIAGLSWLFGDGAAHTLGIDCVAVLDCGQACSGS